MSAGTPFARDARNWLEAAGVVRAEVPLACAFETSNARLRLSAWLMAERASDTAGVHECVYSCVSYTHVRINTPLREDTSVIVRKYLRGLDLKGPDACSSAYTHTHTHTYMYIFKHTYADLRLHDARVLIQYLDTCVHLHVCMCLCVYVCMYACMLRSLAGIHASYDGTEIPTIIDPVALG